MRCNRVKRTKDFMPPRHKELRTMRRLEKIQRHWAPERLKNLPGAHDISSDVIFKAVVDADPTPQKKMVGWLLEAWEQKGFLWEDIRAGRNSKTAHTLRDFERLKKKLTNNDGQPDIPARSLMNYKTPGQIWSRIKPELDKEEEYGETQSSREQKRLETTKARFEALTQVFDSGLKLEMPLTRFSAMKLGRNTKWCTSAKEDNMFQSYMETGMLMIFTIPSGERFQAHIPIHRKVEGRVIDDGDDDGDWGDEEDKDECSSLEETFGGELLFYLGRRANPEGAPMSDTYFQRGILHNIEISFMNEADDNLDVEDLKLLSPYLEEIVKLSLEVSLKAAHCEAVLLPENADVYRELYEDCLAKMSKPYSKKNFIRGNNTLSRQQDQGIKFPSREIIDVFLSKGLLERTEDGTILNPSMTVPDVLGGMHDIMHDTLKDMKWTTPSISTQGLFNSQTIPDLILSSQNIKDYMAYGEKGLLQDCGRALESALFSVKNYGRAVENGYLFPNYFASNGYPRQSICRDVFERLEEHDFFRGMDFEARGISRPKYEPLFAQWLDNPESETPEELSRKIRYVYDFIHHNEAEHYKHLNKVIKLLPGKIMHNTQGVSLFIDNLAQKRVSDGFEDDVLASKLKIASAFTKLTPIRITDIMDNKKKSIAGVPESEIRSAIINGIESGEYNSLAKASLRFFQSSFQDAPVFDPETYPRHLQEALNLYGGLSVDDKGYGEMVTRICSNVIEDDYAYKVVNGKLGELKLTTQDIHRALVSSRLSYMDKEFADRIAHSQNVIELKIPAMEKENISTLKTHKYLNEMKDAGLLNDGDHYVCVSAKPDMSSIIELERKRIQPSVNLQNSISEI